MAKRTARNLLLLAAVSIAVSAFGQSTTAPAKPPAFDVVSIREDKSIPDLQRNPSLFGPTPDGYRLHNLGLLTLILAAYIPSQGGDSVFFNLNQVTGLPDWLPPIRYDIDAKVSEADLPKCKDPSLQPAMLRAMLQAMLADRFKLAVHRGTKETSIYELTVAKAGPKFKPSETTALADIQKKYPRARTIVGGTIVAGGANPDQTMFFGVTMPALSMLLSGMAGRSVQDKTGLTGKYDITIQVEMPPPPQEGERMAAPLDLSSQVFTIVQDQLGLHLEGAKGTAETLVIDHIERPSEN